MQHGAALTWRVWRRWAPSMLYLMVAPAASSSATMPVTGSSQSYRGGGRVLLTFSATGATGTTPPIRWYQAAAASRIDVQAQMPADLILGLVDTNYPQGVLHIVQESFATIRQVLCHTLCACHGAPHT